MTKKFRVFFALALALMLVFTMTACGGKDAEKLVGSWKAELNAAEIFNAALASEPEVAEYLSTSEFIIPVVLTFNSDGTYSMSVDAEGLKDSLDAYKQVMIEGLTKYLEDAIQKMGVSMSISDLLAMSGMTLDSMIDQMGFDSLADQMIEDMYMEGKYDAKDGKLFLSDSLETDVDETIYDTYEFSGKTLKLIDHVSPDMSEEEKEYNAILYPMVFVKAS